MRIQLKSKIHKATVTQADLQYIGSMTIDEDIMDMVNLVEFEKVLVVDNTNGARLETYVLRGKRGPKIFCMNETAAHLISEGDEIIVMGFEISNKLPSPKQILLDKNNYFVKFL